jgi:hypothetical protein
MRVRAKVELFQQLKFFSTVNKKNLTNNKDKRIVRSITTITLVSGGMLSGSFFSFNLESASVHSKEKISILDE